METIAGLLVGVAVGFVAGWLVAHSVVARECDRLGAFYVGDKVYECKTKAEKAK